MNEFARIAKEAIEAAEQLDCTLGEFRVGLAEMWHVINERCQVEDVDPRQMARDGLLSDEE
jgi:hypothetical protein